MQETERVLPLERQRAPVRERAFEQRQRADDVRLHELGRPVDRPVHVRFGGEIEDRGRLVLGKDAFDERAIADVAVHELVAFVVAKRRQRVEIPRVGQLVEIDDARPALRERLEHEVRADETGAAGDEECFHAVPGMALLNQKGR